MHFKTIVLVSLSALLLASVSFAGAPRDEACCKDLAACCIDMAACCKKGNDAAAKVLLPVAATAPAARQATMVWFMKPTMIGRSVLQGRYVIEHDLDRMAKGLPCTHIYAAARPQLPVVKFHCTHLIRARADHDAIVLQSTGDPTIPGRLEAFQFAGESAAHGVPAVR